MSSPAVAERAGWQSRRVRHLPAAASAYVLATAAAAVVTAPFAFGAGQPNGTEWVSFALLLPLAAAAPLFSVSVGRNYSVQPSPAFVVAAALVLPPALVLAIVAAIQLSQILRPRSSWYIHVFNASNYTLSGLAAWAAADAVHLDGDAGFALAGLAAGLTFVLVNHSLLGVMLRLGRGHHLRETGLFSTTGLVIALSLAAIGVAVGAFALFNPWLLPALVAPLALAHRSLATVAQQRESEERFRTMFDSGPSAIMLFGLDGRILAANRSAQTMLGYSEEELVGELPARFRHPDDREDGDEAFARLLRGDADEYRREARFVSRSGETVVAQLATALVRDADLRPSYLIGMAEDVTERKALEERLAQSQKLEAIGRLAGGVAHDFNNMLTAIGGYTDFALEHAPEGSALRDDLVEIRKATDRAAALTRQLLAFSRKQVLKPELLDLNAVVVEVESMLRPLVGADVVLETRLAPALGRIEADPSQLHQVVLNLVVNARDAMPGGGRVVIATANADVAAGADAIEPGRYVTLSVRDDGEGMDAETLARIFEPFFTTKDAGKGTGLGLATVYGIVKQSGGYVAAESQTGTGSCFTIYLRRADEVRAPEAPPQVVAAERSARVLLVEDEEAVLELVRQVLAADGHEVVAARNGEEALAAVADGVDVLLTDLTMPGMDGVELAERLRARLPGLKVVYMSGRASADTGAETRKAGTAFLQKPFASGELTRTVRELLSI